MEDHGPRGVVPFVALFGGKRLWSW